jgi:uncharacterized repeat protein (TIGR01451 family)
VDLVVDPVVTNTKSADYSAMEFDAAKDTLQNKKITYTLTVDPQNAGAPLTKNETAVTSYTVTDTVALPDGLYIAAGDLSSAYTVSGRSLTITPVSYLGGDTGKVTGFDVSFTVSRSDSANQNGSYPTQIDRGEYTAVLNGNYIHGTQGYKGGTIINTVKTSYAHRILQSDGSLGYETASTAPSAVSTVLTIAGSGIGRAEKSLLNREEDDEVCEGETVRYSITVENNTADSRSYLIEDVLSDHGLTFGGLISAEGIAENSYSSQTSAGDGTYSFNIGIPPRSEATVEFEAVVGNNTAKFNENDEYYISNKARVSVLDGNNIRASVDVVAPRVLQTIKTPELILTKDTVEKKKKFKTGEPFTYIITLTNVGGADSLNTSFTDVIPEGLTVGAVSVTDKDGQPSAAISYDSTTRTVSGTGFTVPARGGSFTVTVPVTPTGPDLPDEIVNTAEVGYTPLDPKLENPIIRQHELVNGDIKTTDISIRKEADYGTVRPGTEVNFTITVKNEHEDRYTKSIVIQELPSIVTEGAATPGGLILVRARDDRDNLLTGENGVPLESQPGDFTLERIDPSDGSKGHLITLSGGLGSKEERHIVMTFTTNEQKGVRIANVAGVQGGNMKVANLTVQEYTFPITKTARYSTDGGVTWTEVKDEDPIPQGAVIEFTLTATNMSSTALTSYSIVDIIESGNYEKVRTITEKATGGGYQLVERIRPTATVDKIAADGKVTELRFDYTDKTESDEGVEKTNVRELLMYPISYSQKLGMPNQFKIFLNVGEGKSEMIPNVPNSNGFTYYGDETLKLEKNDSIRVKLRFVSDASAEWTGGLNRAQARRSHHTTLGEANISYTAADELTENSLSVTKEAEYIDEYGRLKTIGADEVGQIPAGTDITFRIKVKNILKTRSITAYKIEDEMTGLYEGNQIQLTLKKNGNLVDLEKFNSSAYEVMPNPFGLTVSKGKFSVVLTQLKPWWRCVGGTVDQPGNRVVLAPGEEMELSYTRKAAETGWRGGTNTVKVYPGVPTGTEYSQILYSPPAEASVTYEKPVEIPALSLTKELVSITREEGKVDDAVDYSKRMDISSLFLDEETAQKNIVYTYKIRLENTSNEDFNMKEGSSYTDIIPKDAVMYNNSNGANWSNVVYGVKNGQRSSVQLYNVMDPADETKPSALNSQKIWTLSLGDKSFKNADLTNNMYPFVIYRDEYIGKPIKLTATKELTLLPGGYIEFYYKTAVPASKAAAIRNAMHSEGAETYLKDTDIKNTVTFDSNGEVFRAADTGRVGTQISAAAKTTLMADAIHPGIYKEYLGTVSALGFQEGAMPNLAGHTELVWRVTLYNGYDNKGKPMSDYKVADVLPQPYMFSDTDWSHLPANVTALPKAMTLYDYDAQNNTVGGTFLRSWDQLPARGGDGIMSFVGSDYSIPSGGKMELIIVTKPNGNMRQGIYTNKAYLMPSDEDDYHDDGIITGTKTTYANKDAILESDSVSIQDVYSRSQKKVTSGSETATSFDRAPVNKVRASRGQAVRYEMEVEHERATAQDDDTTRMKDLVIIDKLPFEGDMAIASDGERGSAFEIKYGEALSAEIRIPKRDANGAATGEYDTYDVKNCLSLSYASQSVSEEASGRRTRLAETDADWQPGANGSMSSVYAWSAQKNSSTNMLRIAFDKLASFDAGGTNPFAYTSDGQTLYGIPAGSRITIGFDGIVPGYVRQTGRSNVAWNSFAYCYSTKDHPNMMAEPAKVGVYIDASDVSAYGNIEVRKIYRSNSSAQRSFSFAVYDGAYQASDSPLSVQTLSMPGSAEGTQTSVYFTDLPLGKTYYVYETDSAGVPLTADGEGAVTIGGQYAFTADKMMESASLTSESSDAQMTFTNTRIIEPEIKIYGPLYADVPTSKTVGASPNMTSTRPRSFDDFETTADGYNKVKDEKRTASDMRESALYSEKTDGYGGQDVHNHTIATGFLAEISGTADADTVSAVTWTVTSTPGDGNHTVPVYVRLRTGRANIANGQEINEAAVLMLNDFAAAFDPASLEERTAAVIGDDAAAEQSEAEDGMIFGEDEAVETIDDELFRAQSIEERTIMAAESLGIDPDKILWNEFGEPYVLLDEEVAEKAEFVSEDAAKLMDHTETAMTDIDPNDTPQTTQKDFAGVLEAAGFGDDSINYDNAYTIFKLTGGSYRWKIFDNTFPRMTLSSSSKVYVGLIIDQLYDQHAKAALKLEGDADADKASIAAPKADSPDGSGTLRYTHVKASEFISGGN